MQIEHSHDQETETPVIMAKNPVKPKLEIKDFLTKGTLIDAKDSMNNWCVAKIIEFFPKEERVYIRYDGWAEKWNDVFFFPL